MNKQTRLPNLKKVHVCMEVMDHTCLTRMLWNVRYHTDGKANQIVQK